MDEKTVVWYFTHVMTTSRSLCKHDGAVYEPTFLSILARIDGKRCYWKTALRRAKGLLLWRLLEKCIES